jgi:hypothetical protein
VAARTYARYRGKRLITCPETKAPAAVEVKAASVALAAATGVPHPTLRDCSRWPEREDCGQECLAQIESAPDGCAVRSLLERWYAGRTCVYCERPIGEIHWYDRRPALGDAGGRTIAWEGFRAEELPEILKTHLPVCWSCHVSETFRREHPDLVVDRPWKQPHAGDNRGNGAAKSRTP